MDHDSQPTIHRFAGLHRFTGAVNDLQPEGAYRTLAAAQQLESQGRSIIHLEIGEPDFATPAIIAQHGIESIQRGKTHYTPAAGIPQLRQRIAEQNAARLGIELNANNVVVGPGAKPLLFLPTLALISAGDEVIYPDPGFPSYGAMIRVAGGTPIPYPIDLRQNLASPIDSIQQRITPRSRLIVINSPSNPTGLILEPKQLEAIASIAIEHDLWVISDEIYRNLTYPPCQHHSILSLPGMKERTILVDGFSKSHAMTGWRLGYGIMPSALAEKVGLLMVHSVGCTAEFTQHAGLAALECCDEQSLAMRDIYQSRRDLIVQRLNQIDGVDCETPSGAFYVFPNVSSLGRSSQLIADALLHEAGVAVLPGTAFGAAGEGYLRLCYANSDENLHEAMDRMATWFGQQTR
ncbi:MAG: pyridoxal phosphate-dependent aminotransferase [Rubripirellula sp.]|nr:pyridoxal phosphate-dependent aminotransferase [Rubripirellula sp.]